jgi:hypothetical protein
MATKIPFAFASAGDTENVPASSAGTELSWQQGWSPAYELAPEDPGYRFISRGQHNFLWNAITANIKEWQDQVYPAHNATIDYPIGSTVRFDNVNYIRLSGSGVTTDPSTSSDWRVAGQFTSEDKTKLNGIEAGAKTQIWSATNNYAIGEEVVQDGLRYIAQAASGTDHGGAVEPAPESTTPWIEVPLAGTRAFEFLSVPVGAEMAFDTPPPTSDPRFRYVRLTADDPYNESLLNNKVISGIAPNIVVKMSVNSELSPIDGQQLFMLNTMGAIRTPSENNGLIVQDAIRGFSGVVQLRDGDLPNILRSFSDHSGVFFGGVSPPSNASSASKVIGEYTYPEQTSDLRIDVSRQVPTADRVQVFSVTSQFYRRIY